MKREESEPGDCRSGWKEMDVGLRRTERVRWVR